MRAVRSPLAGKIGGDEMTIHAKLKPWALCFVVAAMSCQWSAVSFAAHKGKDTPKNLCLTVPKAISDYNRACFPERRQSSKSCLDAKDTLQKLCNICVKACIL